MRATTKSISEQDHEGSQAQPAAPVASRGALARAVALARRYKRPIRLGVLALIVVSVTVAVVKTWNGLPRDYHWTINWWLLVAGFLLLAGQELSFAFIWRFILTRLGSNLDVRSAQQIYLGSEFVRYIPGNVWHVITRIMWAEQRGVPRVAGFASMTVELATKITSAALVFALSLLFWPDVVGLAGQVSHGVPLTIGLVGVPLLLIGLHPRILTSALNFGLRKLGRPPVTFRLGYRDVLGITLLWGLSWIVAGAGFYLVVLSLAQPPLASVSLSLNAVAMAVGIYAIGWDIGFLTFVTPGGLGFRELAIAALLGSQLSGLISFGALALAIAIVARLLSTASELVCVAGAHFLPGGRAPEVPAPQVEAP